MCGIVGVLHHDGAPVSTGLLKRMTDAIEHRGPDDEGHYVDGAVGLGNRRLEIIDPTPAGHQPMSSEGGDVVITYNGEVYNFRELREELRRKGHRFASGTDTEVVLRAYEEWRERCVERFNGMFALAIWDRQRRSLFLARDRYGIKPLYYTQIGDAFLFGSEIKSFLAHDAFRVKVSRPHLLEYFTFQNLFTDGTLFDGVRLLPPGHHMTLVPGERPTTGCYWDFSFEEDPSASESDEEYREELDRLFQQAVQRQLVSDVPLGAHLSGGMDSGSVTALAARHLPLLSTFTVGFDYTSASGLEWMQDERAAAEAMSYLFKTEQFEIVLKAGDMERCLPALTWHLEDLRVGQSYPNYYGARLASKFVKVLLTGTGGDELFAGYPWRYYRALVNTDLEDYVAKYYVFWHRLLPNRFMPQLFRKEVWSEVRHLQTIDIFRDALPGGAPPTRPEEYVNYSLYLEAKNFLHGLLLVEDKLNMAHSVESRVPFLDNDLVDFAQKLPVRLKLRNVAADVSRLDENDPGPKAERYFQETRDGKLLLRQIMSRYVPESTTAAVKRGFSGPDESWFRGDSIEYVRRTIQDDDAALYEFLDPDGVRSLVQGHLEGRENRRLLIWSLLSFEQWCRCFLRGERPD
jgi:asparagine synthase (glutamine-hydrolysing)